MEAVLMIQPRVSSPLSFAGCGFCSKNWQMAYLQPRNTPRVLIVIERSKSLTSVWWSRCAFSQSLASALLHQSNSLRFVEPLNVLFV